MSAAERVREAWREHFRKTDGSYTWEKLADLAVEAVYDGALIDPRTLAGIREVAETLGVSRQAVSNWSARRDRNGFPEPVLVLGMGPIYDLNEVIRWYAQYEPDKGGRRPA